MFSARSSALLAASALYVLAFVFLLCRLSAPSDGTRIWLRADLSSDATLPVITFVDQVDGLRSGDQVVAVGGQSIAQLAEAAFDYSLPARGWEMGDTVTYTVDRSASRLDVLVTLSAYPLRELLRNNIWVLLYLALLQAESVWIWRHRRDEPASQALLLASAGFVGFCLCWYPGMDVVALVNLPSLWLAFELSTFLMLAVMCASLLHFALVLPGRQTASYSHPGRMTLLMVYLAPYPFLVSYLVLVRTSEPLTWVNRWELISLALIITYWLLTLAVVIRGYSRLNERVQRRGAQTLVLAFALVALPLVFLVGLPMAVTGQTWLAWNTVPLLSLPVALGLAIAVVFYHLFDIRVALHRTAVFGTLMVMITAIYIIVVGTLSILFQTQGNPLFSLIATGLAAAAFHMARVRVEHTVSQLLYGERDAPFQVISRLAEQLEGALAPSDSLERIVGAVATGLKLPYCAIELCRDGQCVLAAEWGTSSNERIEFPLIYGAETVGRLVVQPRWPGEGLTAGDYRLLTGLVYQAEIVIQTARLTNDLQRSRERLVMAREEERRRLRRQLHDEFGAALAGLTFQIEATRNLLKQDPSQVDRLLLPLKRQTQTIFADIRQLAYELHSPDLDQLGLVHALRDKAREFSQANGLQVVITAPTPLPPISAGTELAAYAIAVEAMKNVACHAGASLCTLTLTLASGLCIEVRDNGCGLPNPVRRGIGMTSMLERAAELGGTCTFERPADGGTRVAVWLPIGQPENVELAR